MQRSMLGLVLLALLAASQPADGHDWVRVQVPANVSREYVPKLNTNTSCPSLKIAVINGVNFHFEVLASLLHVLKPYSSNVDVYLSKYAQFNNFDGAWDLVHWFPGNFKRTESSNIAYQYDMAFLVSPDYELQENVALLEVMMPKRVVAIIHNAYFQGVRKILTLAPVVHLLTLSPHVATTLATHANRTVDWFLPSYPISVPDNCMYFPKKWVMGLCLRGFAIQGKFSNLRRNYSSIWRQLDSKVDIIRDPQVGKVFHVNVLGKGENRLALPKNLELFVHVHRRLLYHQFFVAIAHNVALVPSLAGSKYLTEKFSSTIMASFISGTPVLATESLLKAYSFLKPSTVYAQKEEEEEADAMIRIARMTADDILKVRAAHLILRDDLNEAAAKLLERLIEPACKEAAATAASGTVTTPVVAPTVTKGGFVPRTTAAAGGDAVQIVGGDRDGDGIVDGDELLDVDADTNDAEADQ